MFAGKEKLETYLRHNGQTTYIHLQWIDFSGILRARFVPVSRCLQIAEGKEEYIIPQVSMIIPVSTAPQCFPTSNDLEVWILHPDWSSIRICGFRESNASVMCFLEHKGAPERLSKCPRTLLSCTLERFQRDWGTSVLAGFEIEVMLLGENF